MSDDREPPRFFGDREGFGWSAARPDDDDHAPFAPESIEGTKLRMMPEYGVDLPLWDEGGPVHDDPEFVRRELGLSDELISDLVAWGREWDRVNGAAVEDDTQPVKPLPDGWSSDHASRGKELFVRLQRELDPRFEVRLHP